MEAKQANRQCSFRHQGLLKISAGGPREDSQALSKSPPPSVCVCVCMHYVKYPTHFTAIKRISRYSNAFCVIQACVFVRKLYGSPFPSSWKQ